jgi:signal transduction histidine kinase
MPPIDPTWAGKVQFYELLFGTWLVYIFLVLMWEKVLRQPLAEWRYVMIVFLGASAFWINHYFQKAPAWVVMINVYALLFFIAYWFIGIGPQRRSIGWKLGALLSALVFTVAYIFFEQIARFGVEKIGMHEFCFMTLTFFGMVGVIWWRGRARSGGSEALSANLSKLRSSIG